MRLRRGFLIVLMSLFGTLPMAAAALTYDVLIRQADVTFVPEVFFLGDHVRVYATLQNLGERDVFGNVFFSENGTPISTAPPFSVRSRGAPEDVWVDWVPGTLGQRQLFVKVVTAPETRDENTDNNEMIVNVEIDVDTDGDRVGNRVDTDDDGDGLPDAFEEAHGLSTTNPNDALQDPDGDGVSTIDEYRRGTDPFAKPPPPPPSSGTSGASPPSSPSGSPVPAPVTPPPPSPQKPVPAPPPASAKAPTPKGSRTPPPPLPVPQPTVERATIALATPPTKPSTPTAPSIVAAPVNAQLELLLGDPVPRRNLVFPWLAGSAAVLAIGGSVLVVRRRR